MSSSSRKIPEGFRWGHVEDKYVHPDGRTWDSGTGVFTHLMSPIPITPETGEEQIQHLDLNAPRVRPEDIDAAIASEQFSIIPGTTLTICILTLQNGYTVTGEAACADPKNFRQEVGERFARDDAKRKLWPLLGYALRERLHRGEIS